MTDAQRIQQKHLRDLERLKRLRLLDDDFMTKCFEGEPEAIQLVLRILLEKPDLVVTDVRTQVLLKNLLNRSVFLDVLASDSAQRKYNVEIQRDDHGAGYPRARFHSSALDTNLLEKGWDFEDLPETYVVFITEKDVIGRGRAVYRVERYFDTGEPFPDGSHIVYVNGAYRDDSPIGRLMHDLACPDPNQMHYDVLADRVRFFKENEKGVSAMCKVFEELRQEGIQEGIQEGMQKGMQKGIQRGEERRSIQLVHDMLAAGTYALEEIAALSGLPLSEIQRMQAARETP